MTGSLDVVRVGISPPERFFRVGVDERRAMLATIADAGIDAVLYADHVSFRGGAGMDGLVLMSALSQLHPTLDVHMGVYLLPLRHPVPVARQLSTIGELAPGRLVFGVGIGGEDRHEIEVCGIDPRTRGRRCDEALEVLRALLTGESVTHHGEFFSFDDCRILPPPSPTIPILVGGRSDAAVRRAGRFGEGWLGTWCSPRRFRDVLGMCAETAAEAGRGPIAWRHQLQFWVGLAATKEAARAHVKDGMEGFYRIPFEAFEKYTPYGTPADVAEFFAPFVEAGLRHLDLTPCSASSEEAIELTAEVKRELNRLLAG